MLLRELKAEAFLVSATVIRGIGRFSRARDCLGGVLSELEVDPSAHPAFRQDDADWENRAARSRHAG